MYYYSALFALQISVSIPLQFTLHFVKDFLNSEISLLSYSCHNFAALAHVYKAYIDEI